MSIVKGVSPKKYSCGHYSTGTLYGLNKNGEPICEECVKKQGLKHASEINKQMSEAIFGKR